MKQTTRYFLCGGVAGFLNGLLGGGGGALFVPLLLKVCHLPLRTAFATSVAVMLPISALSALIYLKNGSLSLVLALPYLLGGGLGGYLGGRYFARTNPVWLRRLFAILLIFSGVRSVIA